MGSLFSFLRKKPSKGKAVDQPNVPSGDDSKLVPDVVPAPPPANGTKAIASEWKKGVFEGFTYNYLHVPAKDGGKATFLLLHGFPNGPSNYKDFIPELTSEGFGVIVPELLGYGESDKPTNVEAYAFNPLCRQIAGILDAEGVEKVVGLGHDFGAPLIARFSQFYPDRVVGIILGGAPYNPPSPTALDVDAALAVIKPALGYENIGYFKFFSADHAPAEIEKHLDSFLSIMFGPPEEWKERVCPVGGLEQNLQENHMSPIEPWFSSTDRLELVEYLKKGGLTGPCMWFRAAIAPVNVADHGVLSPRVKHPYLYISPMRDPSYPLPLASRQNSLCDDITTRTLNTGHWIFEQDPKGAARLVLEWGAEKDLF